MSQEIVKLKARIQNKYETLENWNKLTREDNFIPLKGEVCYGIDNNMLYQKIGNGETNFIDLPWLLNQGDWNESNENSPSYIKNKMGYRKFDTEKSLLYSYDVTQNEYPNFEIFGAEEGMGTIAIMTDYFNKSSNLDIDIYIDNETTPSVSLKDFNIVKTASVEGEIFYYAGNIYPLAMQLLDATEEILQGMGIEKTEDNYGFICVDETDAFGCYIWTEAVVTSYYRLDMTGYGSTIVPIPQQFLDIDYDQFVGRFDEEDSYGEIFNDYAFNRATGSYSHAEGSSTRAEGYGSHAEGYGSTTGITLNDITQFGYNSFYGSASNVSFCEPYLGCKCRLSYTSTLDGTHKEFITSLRAIYDDGEIRFWDSIPTDLPNSFNLSFYTGAFGSYSHSEGHMTTASGFYAHSEGSFTVSSGQSSHAEGDYTNAIGKYSHAEGDNTQAKGESSHSEGYNTKAEGKGSHSEGEETVALEDRSHAEGYKTQATGYSAHAEGEETIASGIRSHAEGYKTQASVAGAHAEGIQTSASAQGSHAEGGSTSASGAYSHAEGQGTVAPRDNQHVQGKYNIKEYINNNNLAHVVGNGTSDTNRSNAHTLDWDGNAWYQGNIESDGNIIASDLLVSSWDEPSLSTKINGFKKIIKGSSYTHYWKQLNSDLFKDVKITNISCTPYLALELYYKNQIRVGHSGNFSFENGTTIAFDYDSGAITIDKKAGDVVNKFEVGHFSYIPAGEKFCFSVNGANSDIKVYWTIQGINQTYVNPVYKEQMLTPEVYTATSSAQMFEVTISIEADEEFTATFYPQLEFGNKATEFAPGKYRGSLQKLEPGASLIIKKEEFDDKQQIRLSHWSTFDDQEWTVEYSCYENLTTLQTLDEELENYVTNEGLVKELENYITNESLTENLENYVVSEDLAEKIKDEYYVFDLTVKPALIKLVSETINDGVDGQLTLSIRLGRKLANGKWISHHTGLSPTLFESVDYYSDALNYGLLLEDSGGITLDGGKFLNSSDTWSLDIADINELAKTISAEINPLRIRKYINNEIEYCELQWIFTVWDAVELEAMEVLDTIATADQFIVRLPKAINYIEL